MEKTKKYIIFISDMGELEAHEDVYHDIIGKYGEDREEEMVETFIKGCKNFARHPQDVLNELERDLK